MSVPEHARTLNDVGKGIHCCLIYDDDEVRLQTMSEFISGGLNQDAVTAYLRSGSEEEWQELVDRIVAKGVSEDQLVSQLEVSSAPDFYCSCGQFQKTEVWEKLRDKYEAEKAANHDYVLVTGEMEWAIEYDAVDKLPAYEWGVNDVIAAAPLSAVCQYDARKFDAETLEQIIQAHPYVILGGEILANPGFLKD